MPPQLRLVLLAALLLIGFPAVGQTLLTPEDSCLVVDHFPAQPVDNAPSKAVLYITIPPEWGGGTIVVQYSGASGNQTGQGTVAPDGLASAELPLNTFGPHQIDQITVTDPAGVPAPVDPGTLSDVGAFTVDESEPQCDPVSLSRVVAATTTTSTATTTTFAPTTTAQTTVTTFVVESPLPVTPAETSNLLPWVLISLGGLLALVGLWLLSKKSCEELYRLWQAAQERYETCAEELLKAQRWLDEKRVERTRHEQELEKLKRSAATGSITQGDTTFQNLPGEGLVTAEGMADIITSVEAQVESAQQAEQMGEEMVNNWRQKTEEAAAEAQTARRAYEVCVGVAIPGGAGTTEEPPLSGPAGPAVATTPPASSQQGCPAGDRRAVPLAPPRTFRVYRAFRIETETEGEAAVGEGGTDGR